MDYREIVLRREPGPLMRSFCALVLRLALGSLLFLQGWHKLQQMSAVNAAETAKVAESGASSGAAPKAPAVVAPPASALTKKGATTKGAGTATATSPGGVKPEAVTGDSAHATAPASGPVYPQSLIAMFQGNALEGSLLSPGMVGMFAKFLPYLEVGLGGALILGFLTFVTSILAGLVMVALLFGKIVLSLNDPSQIAVLPGMFIYVITSAGVIWLSPVVSNYVSLDGLMFGWFWSPRGETIDG